MRKTHDKDSYQTNRLSGFYFIFRTTNHFYVMNEHDSRTKSEIFKIKKKKKIQREKKR